MKRLALAVLVLAVLGYGAWRVALHFVSDETRIRWLIQDMREGFNETDLSSVVGGLAKEYRDESSGADREWVKQVLIALFLQEKDPKTKRFAFEVEIEESGLQIEVEPGARLKATIELDARLWDTRNDRREIAWRFHAQGELEKDDEHGWQFVRTRTTTLEGDRRLR